MSAHAATSRNCAARWMYVCLSVCLSVWWLSLTHTCTLQRREKAISDTATVRLLIDTVIAPLAAQCKGNSVVQEMLLSQDAVSLTVALLRTVARGPAALDNGDAEVQQQRLQMSPQQAATHT